MVETPRALRRRGSAWCGASACADRCTCKSKEEVQTSNGAGVRELCSRQAARSRVQSNPVLLSESRATHWMVLPVRARIQLGRGLLRRLCTACTFLLIRLLWLHIQRKRRGGWIPEGIAEERRPWLSCSVQTVLFLKVSHSMGRCQAGPRAASWTEAEALEEKAHGHHMNPQRFCSLLCASASCAAC